MYKWPYESHRKSPSTSSLRVRMERYFKTGPGSSALHLQYERDRRTCAIQRELCSLIYFPYSSVDVMQEEQ